MNHMISIVGSIVGNTIFTSFQFVTNYRDTIINVS